MLIACILSAYGLWLVHRKLSLFYTSPGLHVLPGPPSPSWLYGNVRQACRAGNSPLTRQWLEKHGSNLFIRWLLMVPALWTADPHAIDHILHSGNYSKPWESKISAARIVGNSILVAEGDVHKKQRKVLNPAFGIAQVRELTDIFFDKSAELRDYWITQVVEQGGSAHANVVDGLKKMTLDVIGVAGFDYHLDALHPKGASNELNQAFYQIFSATPPVSIYRIAMDYVPFLDWFPDQRMRKVKEAHTVMRRIGTQLVQEKKAAILRESSEKSGSVEKRHVHGRDLLTLLIKANLATDIPADQRLSDEEVFAQIPTFLVAGHETTSTAASWCLYALTQDLHIQRELREELFVVSSQSPTMDELSALPYLDCVVKETLRLYTPVTFTLRVALEDDVIPVSKPFTNRLGKVQHEIRITKGDRVILPFLAVHHSTDIWGEDALEFKPDRWQNLPEGVSDILGVWSHVLTFAGGPHACIGFRFAVTELKAIIFTLVRAFEFELAAAPEDVTQVGMFTQRPALKSEPSKGAQLPLRIRLYQDAY